MPYYTKDPKGDHNTDNHPYNPKQILYNYKNSSKEHRWGSDPCKDGFRLDTAPYVRKAGASAPGSSASPKGLHVLGGPGVVIKDREMVHILWYRVYGITYSWRSRVVISRP